MSKNFTVSFANVDTIAANLSDDVVRELEAQADAKERVKRGASWLMFYLVNDWGYDIMRAFPTVGSKFKPGANSISDLNPEEYTKADNTKGERQVSIYAKVWDVSTAGLAHHELVKKHNEAKATAPDDNKWDVEMSRLSSRRTSEINKLKEAFKLYQKIERVNSDIDDAEAELMMDDNGDLPSKSHKSVIITRIDGPKASKTFTTGSFLALDVNKAVEKGATYAALLATVGKGSGAAPEVFCKEITKPVQFDEVIARTNTYFKSVFSKSDSKEYKAILTHLNEKGSDALLLSMQGVYTRLETLLGTPAISARVDKLIEMGGEAAIERSANGGVPMQRTGT